MGWGKQLPYMECRTVIAEILIL